MGEKRRSKKFIIRQQADEEHLKVYEVIFLMTSNENSKNNMDVEIPTGTNMAKMKTVVSSNANDSGFSPYPDMKLAQSIHRVVMMTGSCPKLSSSAAKSIGLSAEYIIQVFGDVAGPGVENTSVYRHLKQIVHASDNNRHIFGSSYTILSEDELNVIDERHRTLIESLEAKIGEAKEKAGDTEVLDARFELARFAAKSLTKTEALDAYNNILKTPKLSSGKSMDALMESARVASFYGDVPKVEDFIAKVCTYQFFLPQIR